MPAFLKVISGSNSGAVFPVVVDKVRLGRHPECEVVIDVNAVSRFHAHVLREGDHFFLEDLQSRNGSFVNGQRVDGRILLHDNDRVKICDTLFVFRTKDEEQENGEEAKVKPHENDVTTTIVTAIDAESNAELMSKVKPEAKLRAILEISQALGHTLDVDHIYPRVLECMFKIFTQADRALILLQGTGTQMIPKAVKHRLGGGEETVRYSRTIVQRAMTERKAILSADASTDERFAMSESIADFRIRSIMCVPLLGKDKQALGVIQIDTQNAQQRFDMDDLQILASVATQASITLENANLHQEILSQERMRRELDFAKEVQTGFLPQKMPQIAGYEFWAYYDAAGQVGGDFYDFVPLPNGRQAIIVGDVAGKGVPAALMMAKASSDVKVGLLTYPDQNDRAMASVNQAICAASLEDKFITLVMCALCPKTHRLVVVNAGHMSPMIRRADGSVEEPAQDELSGLPVGVDETTAYRAVETELDPGDVVLVFSDGISEAMNAKRQTYTTERIREKLRAVTLTPEALGRFLLKDVRAHIGDSSQNDDITMVVFGRNQA